jgi:hypothetical protein
VLEMSFPTAVGRDSVTAANQLVLIRRQTFETDRSPGVKFPGADSQLCTKAITKTVGKSR